MEVVLFFLLKEAHFYLCSLQVTSRCASRGMLERLSRPSKLPTLPVQHKGNLSQYKLILKSMVFLPMR